MNPTRFSERTIRLIIAVVLTAVPLIYFYPAVLGETILAPGDGWTQILGIRILVGIMIASGYSPLWNPLIFGGMPLMASIQPAIFYPPTWFFVIFPPKLAMNVMVITTYHLSLVGTYLYARRIGQNRAGALIAGLAFTFGGYMIGHLGHTSRIAAAAWLPWMLLAIEALYQRFQWRWIALGAAFVALQLFAGEPQMNCYALMIVGAYCLFSLGLRQELETRKRFALGVLLMGVCGVLLSLPQLLPDAELLSLGERASLTYEYFKAYSLPPKQILNLFLPYFFGGAAAPPYPIAYWGEWNPAETLGYVGIIPLYLAAVAVLGGRGRLTWFWAGCALVSLLLSFGAYLPFRIHRVLFEVPVYNLFRAQGRHLYQFTFAVGMLAGLGATALTALEPARRRRVLLISLSAISTCFLAALLLYTRTAPRLAAGKTAPGLIGSSSDPGVLLPLLVFSLSLAAILFYVYRPSAWTQCAIVAVLVFDAMAWGRFFEWSIARQDMEKSFQDPALVKFLKEKEPDPNTYRILSRPSELYGKSYDQLDYPNISIVRGVQSLNGYDPLRLDAAAAAAGGLTLDGVVSDVRAFGKNHRGFDLFNVKYLLCERCEGLSPTEYTEYEKIRFHRPPIDVSMRKDDEISVAARTKATDLAIISMLGDSLKIEDGAPLLTIRLQTADGKVIEKQLLAGRDTAEYAYDRKGKNYKPLHSRAKIIESFPRDDFIGHRYLARFTFDRADIVRIDFRFLAETARIILNQMSLFDAETGASFPLDPMDLPPERWRAITNSGEIKLFENQRALPRGWFVRRALAATDRQALDAIKSGKLSDGSTFDPAETVLVESPSIQGAAWPKETAVRGEAKLVGYEPNGLAFQTQNAEPSVLVLSEVFYPGWQAEIDGVRTPVERVDYTFRAVVVPAGEHRVEFRFRPASLRWGTIGFVVGAAVLALGAVFDARKKS